MPPNNAKESEFKSRDVSESVRENDSEKFQGMYKTLNKDMLQTEKRNQENDLLQLNVHDASMKQFEALLRSNSRTISGNNLDE